MFKVGLSSRGAALNDALFAAYAKQGLDAIEICPKWPDYKYIDYRQVASLAKQYGIMLWSCHLPFQAVDLASSNAPWRVCSLEYVCEIIRQCSEIGIRKFVAHAGMEEEITEDKSARIEVAKDSLYKLAEFAAQYDSVICVEDLPRNTVGNSTAEILDLISVNDKLRVCCDTNHLLTEDVIAFIKRVGDKIVTLHVSDYDLTTERHWLPGEGKIDWNKLIAALVEIGYEGVWMYEINRDLESTNYVENARRLFESYKAGR